MRGAKIRQAYDAAIGLLATDREAAEEALYNALEAAKELGFSDYENGYYRPPKPFLDRPDLLDEWEESHSQLALLVALNRAEHKRLFGNETIDSY